MLSEPRCPFSTPLAPLALPTATPEGGSAPSRGESKHDGSAVEGMAPHHFKMPQRSQEGLYPPRAQARKFPRGFHRKLPVGWDGSQMETPPTLAAPLPPAPGSAGSDPLVTMAREVTEVVLSPEGPHAQLAPHRSSSHLSPSHGWVCVGTEAARLGG